MQPLGRGWARYFTWLHAKRTPRGVIAAHEQDVLPASRRGGSSQLDLWNETGVGREKLLEEIFALLETEGWRYSTDTGWKDWDVQIYGNFWWSVTLGSVTEYHGGPKCLTRVRLHAQMVVTTFLVNAVILSAILYRWAFVGHIDLWLFIPYALFLLILWYRARRLKARVAELVIAGANKCGLTRVSGDKARPKAAK
jgi:hypothetical protein